MRGNRILYNWRRYLVWSLKLGNISWVINDSSPVTPSNISCNLAHYIGLTTGRYKVQGFTFHIIVDGDMKIASWSPSLLNDCSRSRLWIAQFWNDETYHLSTWSVVYICGSAYLRISTVLVAQSKRTPYVWLKNFPINTPLVTFQLSKSFSFLDAAKKKI